MVRGTTPKITYLVSGATDYDEFDDIWVTLASKNVTITKKINDLTIDTTNNKISLRLSQEDSLQLKGDTVETQLKLKRIDGVVIASPIHEIPLSRILDANKM